MAEILSDHEKPILAPHEWLALMAIITFMMTLTGISLYFSQNISSVKTGQPHYLSPQEIEVKVEGAVQNPGIIKLKPSSTRLEAIELAKPLPTADLRKTKTAGKVRNGQTIKVVEKEMITITVTGVLETTVQVPKGTRLQELANHITLPPDADAAKLRKKRLLKDGEEVIVPRTKGRRRQKTEVRIFFLIPARGSLFVARSSAKRNYGLQGQNHNNCGSTYALS